MSRSLRSFRSLANKIDFNDLLEISSRCIFRSCSYSCAHPRKKNFAVSTDKVFSEVVRFHVQVLELNWLFTLRFEANW